MPEYEVIGQHPFNEKFEAEKVAKMLRGAATSMKTGALVEVVRDGNAWVVKVWRPKKGKKDKKK